MAINYRLAQADQTVGQRCSRPVRRHLGKPRWQDLTAWQKGAVTAGAAVQFGLAAAAWADLARRPAAEVRGPKWRWAAVIAVNYAGPIAYFCLGRKTAGRGAL